MSFLKQFLVTFISLDKAVTKMATGWFKMVIMDIFALGNFLLLVNYENMELCLQMPPDSLTKRE